MFDSLFEALWSPKTLSALIPTGLSLLGGLFGKGQKQTVTTSDRSPVRDALLSQALSNLPQPLTEADIAKERMAASSRGRDFAAARGFQAPGAPFVGMPQTISDEAAFEAGLNAQRFNRGLATDRSRIIAGAGSLAPSDRTTTTLAKPNVFEALQPAGKALAGLFGGDDEKRRKIAQPSYTAPGLRSFDTGPYDFLGNTWE